MGSMTPRDRGDERRTRQAVPEDLARRCSLLAEEIRTWPGVTDKPMFGYRAFYRGSVIFAMFPDKRVLEHPSTIAYKLHDRSGHESHKWHEFDLNDDRSVAAAIQTLDKAYASVKRTR